MAKSLLRRRDWSLSTRAAGFWRRDLRKSPSLKAGVVVPQETVRAAQCGEGMIKRGPRIQANMAIIGPDIPPVAPLPMGIVFGRLVGEAAPRLEPAAYLTKRRHWIRQVLNDFAGADDVEFANMRGKNQSLPNFGMTMSVPHTFMFRCSRACCTNPPMPQPKSRISSSAGCF